MRGWGEQRKGWMVDRQLVASCSSSRGQSMCAHMQTRVCGCVASACSFVCHRPAVAVAAAAPLLLPPPSRAFAAVHHTQRCVALLAAPAPHGDDHPGRYEGSREAPAAVTAVAPPPMNNNSVERV